MLKDVLEIAKYMSEFCTLNFQVCFEEKSRNAFQYRKRDLSFTYCAKAWVNQPQSFNSD